MQREEIEKCRTSDMTHLYRISEIENPLLEVTSVSLFGNAFLIRVQKNGSPTRANMHHDYAGIPLS